VSAGPIIIIDPRTQKAEVYWSDNEAAARYRELADQLDNTAVSPDDDRS